LEVGVKVVYPGTGVLKLVDSGVKQHSGEIVCQRRDLNRPLVNGYQDDIFGIDELYLGRLGVDEGSSLPHGFLLR
jgi:hypothetical protein